MASEVDWRDGELRHRLVVEQVYPGQLDRSVPGDLEVTVAGATVTGGYYTDARTSAKVTLADPAQLRENSWVRLVHKVDGTDYVRELGTYVVADVSPTFEGGGRRFELDLRSTLWCMSQDISGGGYTIGKGAKLSDVLRTEFGWANMAYRTDGMVDYRWKGVLVLEPCKDRLSWVFDTLDPTENRVDVDGHGTITVTRYVSPSNRAASMLVDCDDPRSVVHEGSVRWSGNRMDRVNKSVVRATSPNGGEWRGEAVADPSASWSASRRGWTKAEFHDVKDLGSPYTWAHAGQKAKTYLSEDSAADGSWEVETSWLPLREGDVIDFAPRAYDPWGDGEARKCLVKDCEADCSKWKLKLTLKEV